MHVRAVSLWCTYLNTTDYYALQRILTHFNVATQRQQYLQLKALSSWLASYTFDGLKAFPLSIELWSIHYYGFSMSDRSVSVCVFDV